jgi:MFS family permease
MVGRLLFSCCSSSSSPTMLNEKETLPMRETEIPRSETGSSWRIVIVTLFVGLIAAGHVGKLPPALPAIRTQFNLDIVAAGWLASIFSVTGSVAAVLVGAAADGLILRRLVIGGLALMMIGGLAGSFAAVALQLMMSRFLEGIGFLAVVVADPSIIGRATDGRLRRVALGLWPAYMPVGASLMMITAPLVLKMGGWRLLWIVLAAFAMVGIAVMWKFGEGAPAEPTSTQLAPWENIRIAASRVGPWLISGCFALFGMQLYAVITWMPTFMIDERGISAAVAAVLTAAVIVSNGLANPLGSWLLHRGAEPWRMMLFAAAAMSGLAIGMFATWLPDVARYICSALLCGASGLAASAAFAAAPNFAPSLSQLGIVNGFLVQASNIAQFLGPVAAAAIVARFGRWEGAVWLFTGANVLLILLALLALRRQGLLAAPSSQRDERQRVISRR